MEMLASIIKAIKFGNIVIIGISMTVIITLSIWIMLGGFNNVVAQETTEPVVTQPAQIHEATTPGKAPQSAWGLGLIAAAISTSVSAVAAGIAVAIVGSAAMGAVAERPEVMGRSIIFVGLAEGIAIYGLIISIMILGKL